MEMKCSSNRQCCWSHCLKIAVLAVVGIAVLGVVVMLLWNWLVPALFAGAQPLSYWQALGVLALSKILFGSFGCSGHRHWRERQQHWENMTPEEREQLKGRFRSRWSHCCGSHQREHDEPKDAPPSGTPGA